MSTSDVMWVIHALILVNNARKSMLKYIVFVYLLSRLFWSAESQVTKTCLVTILDRLNDTMSLVTRYIIK